MISSDVQKLIGSSQRKIKTTYYTDQHKEYNHNAITWTRVSTLKQLSNTSLENQKEYIEKYAFDHNYLIIESFGEKNESANNEDGKEFNKMLKFAKNRRNNINIILVYKIDRFSRAGTNLIDELREQHNMVVIDVSNPTVPSYFFIPLKIIQLCKKITM